MAMGKPIVATKLHGVMKEFGEGNGLNYCDNPQHCLGKALDMIKLQIIQIEGARSKKFVQNSSWEKITDTFEQEIGHLQ